MNYKIIATPKFSKQLKQLAKKYKKIKDDFEQCIELLEKKPFAGTHLGKSLYKLRLRSSDKSRGKSGGFLGPINKSRELFPMSFVFLG